MKTASKKKHVPTIKSTLIEKKELFCTECRASIENFCFGKSADDIEALRKNLVQCKKEGRHIGEFCSKLFIADDEHFDSFLREIEEERAHRKNIRS